MEGGLFNVTNSAGYLRGLDDECGKQLYCFTCECKTVHEQVCLDTDLWSSSSVTRSWLISSQNSTLLKMVHHTKNQQYLSKGRYSFTCMSKICKICLPLYDCSIEDGGGDRYKYLYLSVILFITTYARNNHKIIFCILLPPFLLELF